MVWAHVLFFVFLFFYFVFLGEYREKKFVTFEKINSFKRGVVRAVLVGIVTIMTGCVCLRAQVGVYFFKSNKFLSPSEVG